LNAVLLQLLTTIVDTLKLYPSAHFSIVTAAMPAAATAAATAGWQQQQQQQQQSNMSNTIAEETCSSGEHLPAKSALCLDDISLNCSLPVLLPAHEVRLHKMQRIHGLT
jgi:ubiquinone biosynthesis protein UbiJ